MVPCKATLLKIGCKLLKLWADAEDAVRDAMLAGWVLVARQIAVVAATPALTEAIQRDISERPTEIRLTGRDTIDVVFWNPRFWWKDESLKSVPEESLPVVRQAAKQVAAYVWDRYGRDAGINVMRISFTRVRREPVSARVTRQVEAQEVTGYFTRHQLETGKRIRCC